MARITVEDCLAHVDNRFELVIVATRRARDLATGRADPKLAWDNDKPTVVALREIAAGHITRTYLDAPVEKHKIDLSLTSRPIPKQPDDNFEDDDL